MVDRSRRDLFGGWFGLLKDASRAAGRTTPLDPESALRPPGALKPDHEFLNVCTRCGDCFPVCPVGAIVALDDGGEKPLPAIAPAAQPCHLCEGLPCIAACSPGALEDPGGPSKVRLGIARVDPRLCITFKGERCDRCYTICPYPDLAIMQIGSRPLVGSGACTGCGLCEQICPTEPKAIVIIPERHLVPGLRVPKSEMQPG